MSYIGQTPTGLYTTTNAKDTFSGNASATSFTLSQAGTTNNVDVFVENVRQEPTVAYVVDGNTLTFTAPPVSGTDNIYVVNRGPAELSASHPASQALEAYSGTFTTDLTVNGAFTSQGIDDNATSTAVTIDGSGNVGIGTSSPYSFSPSFNFLDINGTKGGALVFTRGTNSATNQFMIRTSDDDALRFEYGSTFASEAMRILPTGGITFNGDTSTANALDDYEEGTWTPVLYKGGTQITSPTDSFGYYTKIGRTIHLAFYYYKQFTTVSNGSAWTIKGLPYANYYQDLTNGAYQFISVGYNAINSVNYSVADVSRWQVNTTDSITLYSGNNTNNSSGGFVEFSGTGTLFLSV
jgi:hypothetical protein